MDDTEDDARYPPNPYPSNHHSRSSFPNRSKLPLRNNLFSSQLDRRYPKGDDESMYEDGEELNEDGYDEEEDDEGEEDGGRGYRRPRDVEDSSSSPDSRGKRRKLNKFAMGFEFAPRVAPTTSRTPPPAAPSATRPPASARNNPMDWSEDSTFALLDTWGELYIKNGRKSLRSDEWTEVAKKVNEVSKNYRSDSQCRNRLDTLKKKFKKEKGRMAESLNSKSKWVYFQKMEELMVSPSPPPPPPIVRQQPPRASRGVDSGDHAFANSRTYMNKSNGHDETRDSPPGSELMADDDEDDDSDGLPPQSAKRGMGVPEPTSYRMLADSIQKFGEIYEKIENNKKQYMAELEKMRREFHRDLEVQKRQILERAHAELAKLREEEGDEGESDEEDAEDDNDGTTENLSS